MAAVRVVIVMYDSGEQCGPGPLWVRIWPQRASLQSQKGEVTSLQEALEQIVLFTFRDPEIVFGGKKEESSDRVPSSGMKSLRSFTR